MALNGLTNVHTWNMGLAHNRSVSRVHSPSTPFLQQWKFAKLQSLAGLKQAGSAACCFCVYCCKHCNCCRSSPGDEHGDDAGRSPSEGAHHPRFRRPVFRYFQFQFATFSCLVYVASLRFLLFHSSFCSLKLCCCISNVK